MKTFSTEEWNGNAVTQYFVPYSPSDSQNEPSRIAAAKLGFTFEGIFRQHMIIKGKNRDTAWFSMLDKEWPDAKQKLLAKINRQ